jgi:nitrite reductase/ring-hydroxylating ferredoxin subunit
MPEIFVAKAGEITDGDRRIVRTPKGEVGVFNHKGAFHAYANNCVHSGGPACEGILVNKVVDIIASLRAYNAQVDIYDPWIDVDEAEAEYGISCLRDAPSHGKYAAVILAVGHSQFVDLGQAGISAFAQEKSVIFDVKSILPLGAADGRL